MAVRGVPVVSVPVSDQDRAKAFYVDQLELRLDQDDAAVSGLRWVQVSPLSGTRALTLVTWFDTMPAGSLQGLVLACDDLPADDAALLAKGVAFDAPLPVKPPWRRATVSLSPAIPLVTAHRHRLAAKHERQAPPEVPTAAPSGPRTSVVP